MTETRNTVLAIDISEDRLVISEEEIIELWTEVKMTKSMYDKILRDMRDRIDFMTPKGGSDEG